MHIYLSIEFQHIAMKYVRGSVHESSLTVDNVTMIERLVDKAAKDVV